MNARSTKQAKVSRSEEKRQRANLWPQLLTLVSFHSLYFNIIGWKIIEAVQSSRIKIPRHCQTRYCRNCTYLCSVIAAESWHTTLLLKPRHYGLVYGQFACEDVCKISNSTIYISCGPDNRFLRGLASFVSDAIRYTEIVKKVQEIDTECGRIVKLQLELGTLESVG